MPRLPRVHLEGAIFLISCRGQDGETIFKDKADTQMYLELVNRYKSQQNFRLYAYALLPERLHLLIEPGDDATISQIMHDLNSAYTKYFNGRTQRRGHLFESRFKSSLVEKAKYLVEATRHVHKQASVEGAVSSFDLYVLQEQGQAPVSAVSMETEIREALEFLKNRGDAKQYDRFVVEAAGEEALDLEKSFRRASVIGSPEFVERVQNRIKEHTETLKEERTPAAPARSNRLILFMLGGAVLVATSTSVYFYASRQKMETQYEALVQKMETEASSKVLSENQVPEQPGGAS